MPAPIHVICVAPSGLVAAVQAATSGPGYSGILCTSPLYTESEPTPRTETHRARSGAVNAAQRDQLNAATVDGVIDATLIDPSFIDVRFVNWQKDLPSPYPGLLAEMGLTQNQI